MGRETEFVSLPWNLSRQSNVKDWAGVQKALGRNPKGQHAEFWPSDPRMCCYWLHPFLFGKCSFWIGRCFSVWAPCAKCPGSEGKAGVHARWQGLRLGRGRRARQGPSGGPGPAEPSPGHRGLGHKGGVLSFWPFPPASPPRPEQKGDGDGQRDSNCSGRSQQHLLPEALRPREAAGKSPTSQPGVSHAPLLPAPCLRMPSLLFSVFHFFF